MNIQSKLKLATLTTLIFPALAFAAGKKCIDLVKLHESSREVKVSERSLVVTQFCAGNRELGSSAMTTNKMWFSYPGYSEIMCGFVDTAINKNGYKANPNTNVLEFLHQQKNFKGKVAAFTRLGR